MITPVPASLADAVLATAAERRVLLGLSGGPGSGKSTLAAALASAWSEMGSVVIPMDGFHLTTAELERAGLADRKGAPETFDGLGLADLLSRLRRGGAERVVEISLNSAEQKAFDKSVAAVNGLIDACKKIAPKLA